MKVRNLTVLIIILLFMLNITSIAVLAGDEADPEVDDDTGDGESEFRDIDAAWFGDETNNTIKIYMKLFGPPPPFRNLTSGIDSRVYDYEVYFDVGGASYAAAVSVQYAFTAGGIFTLTIPWVWELRRVSYAFNGDVVQSETSLNETSGELGGQSDILEWTIDKDDIGIRPGNEGIGQVLTRTWAAVWNADDHPAGNERDPETAGDHAHTHQTDPGRNYPIHGTGNVYYNIILSVDVKEKETYGGTPVEFLVSAKNNGSHEFDVTFFVSPSEETWSVNLSLDSSRIGVEKTRTIIVTVTPPKNVENGTECYVTVGGDIKEIDGNGSIPIIPELTFMTIGLASSSEGEDENWWDVIIDNIAIIAGVIAVVVVALIILVVLLRRK